MFDSRAYQYQYRLARLIDVMCFKDVLGENNSNSYDCLDFPFQVS